MDIQFRTKRLLNCYEKSKEGQRQWGEKVARRYIERVNILRTAKSAQDLYRVSVLNFHPLSGKKKGLYALTLIDRWRMEVSFQDQELSVVRVEEVSQHYGD